MPTDEEMASKNKFYMITNAGINTISNALDGQNVPGLLKEEEILGFGHGKDRRKHKVTLEHHNFHWLIERLLSPNESKVAGCELWVPDTAIFENGKPKLVIKTDPKDGCLIKYKKLPTLTDLRKVFT